MPLPRLAHAPTVPREVWVVREEQWHVPRHLVDRHQAHARDLPPRQGGGAARRIGGEDKGVGVGSQPPDEDQPVGGGERAGIDAGLKKDQHVGGDRRWRRGGFGSAVGRLVEAPLLPESGRDHGGARQGQRREPHLGTTGRLLHLLVSFAAADEGLFIIVQHPPTQRFSPFAGVQEPE